MLIITRRKGQRIVLGHDIEIVITDISRSGVKIGIVAPITTTILRGEVRDAVEQANREALESSFVEPSADPVSVSATPLLTNEQQPLVAAAHVASSDR
ncbi:MAG TPA: carbon storage regulator [Polyangiaceae bacterium]